MVDVNEVVDVNKVVDDCDNDDDNTACDLDADIVENIPEVCQSIDVVVPVMNYM